ncbi:hypothetical protein HHK36_004084 [Tetracentron sinense]|uniref:RRM domain-containing protein n=1 Tax=Tetracentron sinense TaxID=13715 RepID=A0A834ZZ70_TETSI|nr:hypothetical protein HHK36_004084 [Tetracentron sinense]
MAKNNKKKRKLVKKPEEITKTKPNKKKLEKAPAIVEEESDGDSSEPDTDPEKIQKLLEPYTKSQLIEYICDAAIKDTSLFERILNTADRDVSHRKIFVYGLSWDTTRENLTSAFESFGQIEDCNVIIDRVTGKAKGYGFVLFKSRAGAAKALKLPQKKINNRLTNCQLASTGSFPTQQNLDTTGRKIYVSNVHSDIDPERLRLFFAKFGEIETGPLGFDLHTGKSRGFALFVYRTHEGANKVLEEPYKLFEGHQLHCQIANENKNKPFVQPVQAPVLAAVAAAQNLAMFSQHPGFNPAYNGFFTNPNAGMMAGSVNPMVAGALNPGMIPSPQMPGSSMRGTAGMGGYGAPHGMGNFGGNPSLLGAYGSAAPMQGPPQYYQNPHHLGPSSSARPHPAGGSLSGFPSYMW